MSRELDLLIRAGQQIIAVRDGRDHRLSHLAREIFNAASGDTRAAIAEVNRRLLLVATPCVYVHNADDRPEGERHGDVA